MRRLIAPPVNARACPQSVRADRETASTARARGASSSASDAPRAETDTREASRGLPRPTLSSSDANHLESELTAWTGDGDDVAGGSAKKCASDRRVDRHTSLADVTLD